MRQKQLQILKTCFSVIIGFFLIGCKTPIHKMIYEIMPAQGQICRYEKISALKRKKIKCYKVDAKKDGKYIFDDTLVIKKRAVRELLIKQVDQLF